MAERRTAWSKWIGAFTAALLTGAGAMCGPPQETTRQLLVLIDGLRPDYVTPEVMPNLTALGKRGVVFTRHHSVFPTVTRVNASSISTGAYPGTHGLLGNSVFFPKVDAAAFLDTSDRQNLLKVAKAEGQLLTAPTLGESLQAAGHRMLVVSSGSTGSAFLNNHTLSGGAILHYSYALPEALGEKMKVLGPPPGEKATPTDLDHYAVDAFLKVGLPDVDPTVTVMWLSGLDSVAHEQGVGAPATVDTLRKVDAELGRIEEGLRAAGLSDRYNIWVTSDHGFSTHTGSIDLQAILKPFAGTLPDGSPRIVAGAGAVYVRDDDATAIQEITKALQKAPRVGAVFTRAAKRGELDGQVAGTLSFDAVRWDHPRSAQILYSPDWTNDANNYGMRGTVASGGVAGHGSSSVWDVHNTLIAAGPGLTRGVSIDTSSANVDFAPTFLSLLGLPIPASMQGRPLAEALARPSGDQNARVHSIEHTSRTADGTYAVTARFSIVTMSGTEYRYFDEASVQRK
jgi:predicted AlkP superfamily pyrophosphatase or phosphodiesterase